MKASLLYVAYYFGASIYLDSKRRKEEAAILANGST